jgi:hypothetical protein
MDLTAIFIMGFIVLGTYKTIELVVRRKERLAIVENLAKLSESKEVSGKIQLPDISFGYRDYGYWPLRVSLLLVGIGAGCLLSFLFQLNAFGGIERYWEHYRQYSGLIILINFACISLLGGIGLLIAYLIESKGAKTKQ